MRAIIWILSVGLPWPVRRWVLERLLGYRLHPTCRIGFCLVLPKRLVMGANSRIGALTVCRGLDLLQLEEEAVIGRLNWITAYPSGKTDYFGSAGSRQPILIVRNGAAITSRHLIDCTAAVIVGKFSTVAGYGSQILTHSIDLAESRQDAHPINIGAFCFVGTGCVVLGGTSLPDYSVLSAMSLLNRAFTESFWVYGGVPARPLKTLPEDLAYFKRASGVVR